MSSPFNPGRDSNAGPSSNQVTPQADLGDGHQGTVSSEAYASPSNNLGEADYRG